KALTDSKWHSEFVNHCRQASSEAPDRARGRLREAQSRDLPDVTPELGQTPDSRVLEFRGYESCHSRNPGRAQREPGPAQTKAPRFTEAPDDRIRDLRGYG